MNMIVKRMISLSLALSLTAGAASVTSWGALFDSSSISVSATAQNDSGVLTLSGNVTKDELDTYRDPHSYAITKITAAEGTARVTAFTYAYHIISAGDSNISNITKAMYKYNRAAQTYFDNLA